MWRHRGETASTHLFLDLHAELMSVDTNDPETADPAWHPWDWNPSE